MLFHQFPNRLNKQLGQMLTLKPIILQSFSFNLMDIPCSCKFIRALEKSKELKNSRSLNNFK